MVHKSAMSDTTSSRAELLIAMQREPMLAECSPTAWEKFIDLIQQVDSGQNHLNLTAIREPLAMVRYHLADSLALDQVLSEGFSGVEGGRMRCVDVGTGGGFPLLPMAIARPDCEWIGVESVAKKAAFVERTAAALGLQNVSLIPQRAEDAARTELRGTADVATARAVGPIASLAEVCAPFLKTGGVLYLFKTEASRQEWQQCESVLQRFGLQPAGEFSYQLSGDEQNRLILKARKVEETPDEFPRRAGVPFKRPMS